MSGFGFPCCPQSATGRLIRASGFPSRWPLSSVMAALPAMATTPGFARGHVRAALIAWNMRDFAEVAELVVSELVTNAVRASEQRGQSISGEDGQTPVIRVCLLADGIRLRIEISDRAPGLPFLREASIDSERGRGLALVDSMTAGRWGWCPASHAQVTKYVWAEIRQPTSEADPPLLTFPIRHPNSETGGRNMTTTGTKLAPPTATRVRAIAAVPPLPETKSTHPGDNATIPTGKVTCPRESITPDLFSKLTYRVRTDDGYDVDTAGRIVEQALAFLLACARHPDSHLSPSGMVDAGWHAFILHTFDYAAFCDRVAGRLIHHRPNGAGEAESEQQAIGITIAAMRDAGLPVDPDLWVPRAECSQCYQGCADDPKGV
jgi:anti-sigma regulatory factor (Ser/Thr protein kinase)